MKPSYLRKRATSKTRYILENALTMGVWGIWIWSAIAIRSDWEVLQQKHPRVFLMILQGAAVLATLFIVLWIRSRFSLPLRKSNRSVARLDRLSVEKCLSLMGWNWKTWAAVQRARFFNISIARENLRCKVSIISEGRSIRGTTSS